MNPFEFVKSVTHSKEYLMVDEDTEKKYNSFIVNRALMQFHDTILLANMMNQYHHLDEKLQYDFLLNTIRKRKRFSKWTKQDRSCEIEAVMEYYGYNRLNAEKALTLLSPEQIDIIKQKVDKGG